MGRYVGGPVLTSGYLWSAFHGGLANLVCTITTQSERVGPKLTRFRGYVRASGFT